MIKGHATAEGTGRFARSRTGLHADHWRRALGVTVSSLGLGSYLGNPDGPTDEGYASSTRRALQLGINLIDTAVNYRFQRSERAIGAGLSQAVEDGGRISEIPAFCRYFPEASQNPLRGSLVYGWGTLTESFRVFVNRMGLAGARRGTS